MIIAMSFQSVMLLSFLIAIVYICRQPKVNSVVLVIWVDGMVFICVGFVLIVILANPSMQASYYAPVVVWLVDFC